MGEALSVTPPSPYPFPMTQHATLVFQRTLPAAVPRVWQAFADPAERAIWGVPSETAVVIYEQAGFRVGGTDIALGHMVERLPAHDPAHLVPQMRHHRHLRRKDRMLPAMHL